MDWAEESKRNELTKAIWDTLKRKGYKDLEMTYGNVMDDFWVTLKGPGVFLDVCAQYYQNDAFKAMLHEVENKL